MPTPSSNRPSDGLIPRAISNSACRPASLWARSISTLASPSGTGTVQTFIRPGLSAPGSKARSPSAICSTVRPIASAAEVTAKVFSTFTRLSPANVIGTSITGTTGSGSAPGCSTATQPSITVVTRPPASMTVRPAGEFGSMVNTHTRALVPSRMAKVRGSSAFSTHQPVGRVIQ